MPKFPIALSIVVLCLLVAIGQNWSPSLPIVFLGTTSIALPLGVWVGLAIVAGALGAMAIGWLFQLAISSQPHVSRPSIGASPPPPAPERAQRTWDDRTVASGRDLSDPPIDVAADDPYEPAIRDEVRADEPAEDEEEWDNEEEWIGGDVGEARTNDLYTQNSPATAPSFEVKQEPISTSQEGSMYSYSYRKEQAESRRSDDIYAAADDERHEGPNPQNNVPSPTPVPPESEVLEPEIVDPFPAEFPESFEEEIRPSDRPSRSEPSSNSSPTPDDDWTNSAKPDREDW